jgi:hypothetical protein
MTTTVRHQPTRTRAAVAIAGRAGWTPLRAPNDLELAEQVRRFALTRLAARTPALAAADRDRHALARIAAHYPTATETFGRPALLALTRRPGPGSCAHCAAALLAATFGEPRPDPTASALGVLLGRPCRRCVARHRVADHVAAVAAASHVEQAIIDQGDNRFTARIGYWAHRLGVPAATVAAFAHDALHPRSGGRPGDGWSRMFGERVR